MKKAKFSKSEWGKINKLAESSAEDYGLPRRRSKSVVIGTFNIRELGAKRNRASQSWDFLEMIIGRFDLLAIQEVMDDLEGLNELKERVGNGFGLVVSDVTGVFPGASGNAERLAYLFNWKRIQRTALASDITYDRSQVVKTLFGNHKTFQKAWKEYAKKLDEWDKKAAKAKAQGKRKPKKPPLELPLFLTFIRQPHCASFQVMGKNGGRPLSFLAVNAHLLYGVNATERRQEFDALIGWLTLRAKQRERMYHKNIIMMGDCNLEFEKTKIIRQEIDDHLRSLNKTVLKNKKAAEVNFPLLTDHPAHGSLRTNARNTQTYDQMAIFFHDRRFPSYKRNAKAGKSGKDGYDYGVFNFTDLFADALFGKRYSDLPPGKQNYIISRCQFDISDHMPAWIRLPIPGA